MLGWLSDVQELVLHVDRLTPKTILLLVTEVDRPVQFLRHVLQVSEAAVHLALGVAAPGVVGIIALLMKDKECLLPAGVLPINCKKKLISNVLLCIKKEAYLFCLKFCHHLHILKYI